MNFTFALEQFELFVLILIRLASFVFAAPFFNMANVRSEEHTSELQSHA